jgi:hypothetical protein
LTTTVSLKTWTSYRLACAIELQGTSAKTKTALWRGDATPEVSLKGDVILWLIKPLNTSREVALFATIWHLGVW